MLDLPDEILQCQRLQVMYTQYVYMMSMSYYNSRSGFTAQGRPLHLSKILNLRVVGYFRSGRFLLLPYDMLGQPLGKGITRVMDVLFALLALASVCVPAYLYRSAESSYSSWITMALLLTTIIIPFLYVLGSVIINDEIGINSSTWMSGHNRVKWRNRAGDVNRANAVAVITIILEYFQVCLWNVLEHLSIDKFICIPCLCPLASCHESNVQLVSIQCLCSIVLCHILRCCVGSMVSTLFC